MRYTYKLLTVHKSLLDINKVPPKLKTLANMCILVCMRISKDKFCSLHTSLLNAIDIDVKQPDNLFMLLWYMLFGIFGQLDHLWHDIRFLVTVGQVHKHRSRWIEDVLVGFLM